MSSVHYSVCLAVRALALLVSKVLMYVSGWQPLKLTHTHTTKEKNGQKEECYKSVLEVTFEYIFSLDRFWARLTRLVGGICHTV